MTKVQMEILAQIGKAKNGYKPVEYNFGNKTRVCERLVEMGLASHYPHGGFMITNAGREILQQQTL